MKKGFTIVELMIYMGLMATILVVLTEMFLSVLELQSETKTISNVEADGRFILARMFHDINRASSIELPSSLGQTADSTQLTIDSIANTYSTDENGNLIITNGYGINSLTGYDSSVSGLTFLRMGNAGGKNSLQIKFTLISRTLTKTGKIVKDFQTTVGIR